MTEEQIRQNANEYAEQYKMRTDFGCWWPEAYDTKQQAEAYIAGAHSRDEEISQWKLAYNNLLHNFNERGRELAKTSQELDQLRNPWISVEERLPKEHQDVLIENWRGLTIRIDSISIDGINYMKDHPNLFPHWMLTPKIGK